MNWKEYLYHTFKKSNGHIGVLFLLGCACSSIYLACIVINSTPFGILFLFGITSFITVISTYLLGFLLTLFVNQCSPQFVKRINFRNAVMHDDLEEIKYILAGGMNLDYPLNNRYALEKYFDALNDPNTSADLTVGEWALLNALNPLTTKKTIAGFLLEQGVNVDAQSHSGNTALHLTLFLRPRVDNDMVQLIMRHHPDVNIINMMGRSALDLVLPPHAIPPYPPYTLRVITSGIASGMDMERIPQSQLTAIYPVIRILPEHIRLQMYNSINRLSDSFDKIDRLTFFLPAGVDDPRMTALRRDVTQNAHDALVPYIPVSSVVEIIGQYSCTFFKLPPSLIPPQGIPPLTLPPRARVLPALLPPPPSDEKDERSLFLDDASDSDAASDSSEAIELGDASEFNSSGSYSFSDQDEKDKDSARLLFN